MIRIVCLFIFNVFQGNGIIFFVKIPHYNVQTTVHMYCTCQFAWRSCYRGHICIHNPFALFSSSFFTLHILWHVITMLISKNFLRQRNQLIPYLSVEMELIEKVTMIDNYLYIYIGDKPTGRRWLCDHLRSKGCRLRQNFCPQKIFRKAIQLCFSSD